MSSGSALCVDVLTLTCIYMWKSWFGLVSVVSGIITVSGLSVVTYLLGVSVCPTGFSGLAVPKPVSTVFTALLVSVSHEVLIS